MLLRRDIRPGQPRLRAFMARSVTHPFMLAWTAASVELSVILNQGIHCPGLCSGAGRLYQAIWSECGVGRFACRRVQASLQLATLGPCLVFAGLFSSIHMCGVV